MLLTLSLDCDHCPIYKKRKIFQILSELLNKNLTVGQRSKFAFLPIVGLGTVVAAEPPVEPTDVLEITAQVTSSETYNDLKEVSSSVTNVFRLANTSGEQNLRFNNVAQISLINKSNSSAFYIFQVSSPKDTQKQNIYFTQKAPLISSSSGVIFSAIGNLNGRLLSQQNVYGDIEELFVTKGSIARSLNIDGEFTPETPRKQGAPYGVISLTTGARQVFYGNIGAISTGSNALGTAIYVRGDNPNSTSYPAPTEQAFLGTIGDIGSASNRFLYGISMLQQADQYIEEVGTIYATFRGVRNYRSEHGSGNQLTTFGKPTGQYLKSVEMIDLKRAGTSYNTIAVYNWNDNGNKSWGRQYIGLRGKKIGDEYVGISVEDRLRVPIALQNIGGVQEIEALNHEGVAINLIGNAGYTAFVQGQINNKNDSSRESVLTKTSFTGPFTITAPLKVRSTLWIGSSAKPPLEKGISALEFSSNEFGRGSKFNPGAYIDIEKSTNTTPLQGDENAYNNTRLIFSNSGLTWSYSNYIHNLGVLRSSPLVNPSQGTSLATSSFEFNTVYISSNHVNPDNQPSPPPSPDTEEPDPDSPDPVFPEGGSPEGGSSKNDGGAIKFNSLTPSALIGSTASQTPDEGSEEPKDPDEPDIEVPEIKVRYKYPYGNGPYMNYWAIGSSATTAPYFYFEKIETSDGKAVKADRSNASSLDFYVKPTNFYKDGVSTVGTLNADNFCAGESCGDTKEIAPGWQGAPSDKRLAAAFWLLRSAANSIYAKEGIENIGSQDYILIKDDYEEGFNGLTKGTMWIKTTDEEGNEIVKRDDPNGENPKYAHAAGWVIIPEGVVNHALKAQWYFEDIDLVQEANSEVPEKVKDAGAKYRGEIIDLATWFPWEPMEPGFTHPFPLIPATPIPKPQPTPTMKSIESVSLSHYFTWRQEIDTLHQRLGEVRDNYELEGLWARGYVGRNRFNHNGYYFKDNYKGIQIGIDRNYFEYKDSYRCRDKDGENFPCKREKAHEWIYGAGLSYTDGDLKLSRGGNADNWMASFWLYGVRKFSNGGYLDLVGKVSRFSNKFSAWSSDYLLNTKGHDRTWGYTLSAEYGNKHYIYKNKDWYFDPQLQIIYGRILGSDFRTNNNVNVRHKAVNSLIGRAGIALGYEAKEGSAFVKVDALREFKGRLDTTYKLDDGSSNRSRFNLKETWGEVSAGGTYTFSQKKDKFAHFYVKRSFASKLKADYRVDIGFEYIF